jgi:hypothetical protein
MDLKHREYICSVKYSSEDVLTLENSVTELDSEKEL